jgi:predicted MFS family arabinose efflux permease
MAQRVLPESRAQGPRRRLDFGGAVTITAGLAIVVYGIVGTDTHSWGSTQTVMALLGGAAFLAAALFIEARVAGEPLVPLGIFRRRSLCAANGIGVTIGAALFGMYFFVSLYLQELVGFSPLRTGLAILPAGTMTLLGALAAPRLMAVIGPRRQLVLGPALAAAGLLWVSTLTFGANYWAHMFGPLALFGLGIGLSFVPMTLTATAGIPRQEAGLASGLINTTRQMGGAVGLAVLATLASATTRHDHSTARSVPGALTSGYDRAFLIAGLLLLAGAALATLIRPAPQTAPAGASGGTVANATEGIEPSPTPGALAMTNH